MQFWIFCLKKSSAVGDKFRVLLTDLSKVICIIDQKRSIGNIFRSGVSPVSHYIPVYYKQNWTNVSFIEKQKNVAFFNTVKTINISGDADIFKHLDVTTKCSCTENIEHCAPLGFKIEMRKMETGLTMLIMQKILRKLLFF